MGGVTSTLVTRPSAVTQKRTSWRLPCASRGAPGGGEIAHSGVAAKISLAAPPEPEPESAPTPGPVPVPLPPPVPGPSPGPPAVPSPVPIAVGGARATVGAGGGMSSFTRSVTGAATVGTVTVGAGGIAAAIGEDGVGSANQLTADRPPPPPPPRDPAPARPPPRATAAATLEQLRAAPQHEDGDREVRRERKRRGRPLAPPLHRQRVGIKQRPSGIGHWTNTYPITKTGARFPCPGVPERRGIPSALPALPPPQA